MFLQAFGGAWIWPLLGVLFLPLTTVTWVQLRKSNKRGLGLVLVPAVLFDLSGLARSGHTNEERATRQSI
jgi:hypothetical protein